ncbi:unnamed protein product, partial [marine sediment metagenome]
MKRGTDLKLKFKLLQNRLGMSAWEVKGLLQSLWDFTAENAQTGDIGRYSDEEILIGLEWTRDESPIPALVETHWLDECQKHRLVVHGWSEHCEDWVKKRVIRAKQEFADVEVNTPLSDNGGQRRTTADNGGSGSTPVCLPGPGPGPGPEPCDAAPAPSPATDPPPTGDPDRVINLLNRLDGEPDEKRAWLADELPVIDADVDAGKGSYAQIVTRYYRQYLKGARAHRGAGQRESEASKAEQWEADH